MRSRGFARNLGAWQEKILVCAVRFLLHSLRFTAQRRLAPTESFNPIRRAFASTYLSPGLTRTVALPRQRSPCPVQTAYFEIYDAFLSSAHDPAKAYRCALPPPPRESCPDFETARSFRCPAGRCWPCWRSCRACTCCKGFPSTSSSCSSSSPSWTAGSPSFVSLFHLADFSRPSRLPANAWCWYYIALAEYLFIYFFERKPRWSSSRLRVCTEILAARPPKNPVVTSSIAA